MERAKGSSARPASVGSTLRVVRGEQPGAQLYLEVTDRGGQPGLGDAGDLGGAGELPLVREGDQVFHLTQFH